MKQKILMEQPTLYKKGKDTLTKINDGWVTDDGEMFTRLLRKETFFYTYDDNGAQESSESKVVIETLETIKGTMYMKRKIKGTLFDDVQ